MNLTPYENLSPNVILDAIESQDFQCSGSLIPLNSYENRVYQIGIEENRPIVAKFYRPGRWSDEAILEEHQFALELVDRDIPVVPPLVAKNGETLHHYQDYRFALFPSMGGRALELDRTDQIEWMGRFIGRMHAVSACKTFQHRHSLTIQRYGYDPYQFLLENNFIPDYLLDNYRIRVDSMLDLVAQAFDKAGDVKMIRIHGDMHAGNILWRDEGPHIVDLDDCLMGPAIQDIWMLLSGDKKHVNLQLDYILEEYQQFHDFNYRELHLIEALRTLRMLHHSGWLAKRWDDPAFPPSFPWFNTPNYWQEQIRHFDEQIDALQTNLQSD